MIFADGVAGVDQFINYGSFGLVAFLVFAFVYWIWPNMRKEQSAELAGQQLSFQAALTKVVDASLKEAEECRAERMQIADHAAAEREKDRELRHMLNNTMHELIASIQSRKGDK